MVRAALSGQLDEARLDRDPVFGFEVPVEIAGVPTELLRPRQTWADTEAYDAQQKKVAGMFVDNFQQYAGGVTDEIIAAAPRV
jgi:phosphoenolpyruvate carboxykinase (ATP)